MIYRSVILLALTLFGTTGLWGQSGGGQAGSIQSENTQSGSIQSRSAQSSPFAEYWAGSCLQAVMREHNYFWRDRADTALFDLDRDTLVTISAETASRCLSQIKPETVKTEHLILLARLYLAAGDDSSADRAVEKRLQSEKSATVEVRSNTLAAVISAYVNAKPARVSKAEAYLSTLEGLDVRASSVSRVRAYRSMLQYYVAADNDSRASSLSDSLISIGKKLSARDRKEFGFFILNGYSQLAEIAGARTGEAAEPVAIIERAKADLSDIPELEETIASLEQTFSKYGIEGGQITGDFWFGHEGDSIRPAPNRISIISFQPNRHNIASFTRLLKSCPNVQMTFLLRTNGYFKDEGPFTPEEESVVLKQYYIDELKLPGALVISSADVKKMDDGRLLKGKNANALVYGGEKGRPGTVVVDKNGVIRRVFSGWAPWVEREIQQSCQQWNK